MNKIIDDKTGRVLDQRYWIGDAQKRTEELGVSTDYIDEEETKHIQEAYQSGVQAGKAEIRGAILGK